MSWDGLDRRKFPRVIYPCLVTLCLEGKEKETILSHTENIGLGGVCVTFKNHVERFTPVEVQIDLLDMQEHLKCSGKVVWNVRRKALEERKPLFYDIGIEFGELKDSDRKRLTAILKNLVDRKAAPVLKPYL